MTGNPQYLRTKLSKLNFGKTLLLLDIQNMDLHFLGNYIIAMEACKQFHQHFTNFSPICFNQKIQTQTICININMCMISRD